MKLHIGSGSRYLEGYIHIDIAEYDHIDITTSVDKLNSLKNNSADEIYASHVLEYFDQNEVEESLVPGHLKSLIQTKQNDFEKHGFKA